MSKRKKLNSSLKTGAKNVSDQMDKKRLYNFLHGIDLNENKLDNRIEIINEDVVGEMETYEENGDVIENPATDDLK